MYQSFTAHQHHKGHTVPKQVSPIDDDIPEPTRKKPWFYSLKTALSKNCNVWEHSLSGQVWTKCLTRPDTQGAPRGGCSLQIMGCHHIVTKVTTVGDCTEAYQEKLLCWVLWSRLSLINMHLFVQTNEDAASRRLQDLVEYKATQRKIWYSSVREIPAALCMWLGKNWKKKTNTVRGCVKLLQDRNVLPETADAISTTPDDELTLFLFLNKDKYTYYMCSA